VVIGAVVACLVLGGSGDDPTKPWSAGVAGGRGPAGLSGGAEGGGQAQQPAAVKPPPPKEAVDVTNLLPNDTEAVISVNVPRALESDLRRVFLDVRNGAPGGFSLEAFGNTFGIPADDIRRLLLASNATDGWEFGVISTLRSINLEDLKKRLALQPAPSGPIKGQEFFLIPGDLDGLSSFLFKRQAKPLALYQVNDNTLVIAHQAPMEKFLDAQGRPKPWTEAMAQGALRPPPPNRYPPPSSRWIRTATISFSGQCENRRGTTRKPRSEHGWPSSRRNRRRHRSRSRRRPVRRTRPSTRPSRRFSTGSKPRPSR
jgi:hypothetical protein